MDNTEPILSLTKEIKNLSSNIEELMKYITRQQGYTAIPHGNINIKKYKNYYDVSHTITTAMATPNDEDATGYNQENIYRTLERYADTLLVANDGTDTLFVVISHGGETNLSHEVPIYPGEVKIYWNVYQLLLRSATAGLPYRVMEYDLDTCCSGGGGAAASKSTQAATLSNATINAASQNTSAALDVRAYRYMTITLRTTMNAAASADPAVTVDVLTSYDNTNFDTFTTNEKYVYVTAIALALDAGNTRQKTSNLIDLRGINYIEIVTNNKDAAQSITATYLYVTLVR